MTDRKKTRRFHALVTTALLLGALPAAAAIAKAGSDPDPSASERPRARPRVVRPAPPRALLAKAKRGFLGVDLLDLTPELRRHFGSDGDAGVLVAHVEAGTPAALAGVAVGDVLTAIEGKRVKSTWDMRGLIGPRKAGEAVTLDVVRAGSRRQLQATLIEREGRVLEMGRMMRGHLLDGENGENTIVVVPNGKEWEEFGEEMGKWGEQFGEEMGHWGEQFGTDLAEAFSDPNVKWRIEREFKEREELQGKIELLERRLRDLEKRLEEQNRR